jgi:acetate kinase
MRVLTVNPGSTSLKLALVSDGETLDSDATGSADRLAELTNRWGVLDAVGVRFVHGGPDFLRPTRLDAVVLDGLDEISDLAPLHYPPSAAAARALLEQEPERPVVGCFDTTFFADLPTSAVTYALPRVWNQRWSLRRYGFHGLSHRYAVRRAGELTELPTDGLRVVTCHLGGGASLAASVGGRPVDTTMGFTPLEGLVMATRAGSVDPGLLTWLVRHGVRPDELDDVLQHRSGLAGLTGTDGDLRVVVERAHGGDVDCRLAVEVYLHRLVREAGAMVASAGGLDVLVLTGGVGEHSTLVQERLGAGLAHLGVAVDLGGQDGDRDVSHPGSAVRVLIVTAREELMIAEEVTAVLGR